MLSRRDFVKLTGMGTGLVLLSPMTFARAVMKKDEKNLNLFFEPSQIPELQKRLDLPLFKPFWEKMLNADLKDDKNFLKKRIQFNNQLRHLHRVDRILQREAFIYVMTGDKKRGKMAKLALEKVLQFKKWDYFIEAGKDVIGLQRAPFTTQSVVLAYPWIEDLLSGDMKKEVFAQLPEKGCEPCYRSLWGMLNKEKVVGWGFDPESSFYEERDFSRWPWILSRTNLRAVPMSALALGAVFLEGKDNRVERWMDVVKQSYDDFVDLFEKDGSYNEGTGYCNYTSSELIIMLDILQRRKNLDWSRAVNWNGVMDFFLMTRMPSEQHPDGHVNFGDGGGGFFSDVGYWVARKYRNHAAQYAAENHSRMDRIFSVIWYDPTVAPKKPTRDWYYREFDIGWVVISTGFEKEDFVVALRSGGPANHENADRNSFILKCYSENLLVDNWHPPYDHNDPGWPLRTSPAHNTVLIDGKGHQYHDGSEGTNASKAEAKIIRTKKADDYAFVTSDATQAYQLVNENVKNVNRTFVTIPRMKFAVIVDRLETQEQPAEFAARWFVENEDGNGKININGESFEFLRTNAKLFGKCAGDLGVNLSQANFPVPKESGVYPHLDVKAEKNGNKVMLITAVAALRTDEKPPFLDIRFNGKNWVVNTDIGGREAKVIIIPEEKYPKILVRIM